jgi:predicted RNA-binding Zn-ribbon protein involved in translation (DUF1610 family)
MYQQNYNFGSKEPSAFITVRKQRQKQNGKNVYLHDRTEFEIELHNPTNDSILAKISLNGNRISNSGVVLKPGQRVFLERYLDEDRKFLFETYEVSDNKTNQRAIENNGLVIVEFFNKMLFTNYGHLGGYTYLNNQLLYGSGSGIVNGNPTIFNTTGLGNSNIIGNTSTSDAKIETGRVEKGDKSDQEFGTSYEIFNTNVSWVKEWKILPFSAKDITTKDLIRKCSGCGTKVKDNYKFCPQCGNQVVRTKTEIHYTTENNVSIGNTLYTMVTYRETLDNFLKRNENKLIYIQTDSLRSNGLKAIVIN